MNVITSVVKLSCIIALLAVGLAVLPVQHPTFVSIQGHITDCVNKLRGHVSRWTGLEESDDVVTEARGERGANKERLFTKEELSTYSGQDGSLPIYLAIYGRVYDVSEGARYYGPEGGYKFFSGRDGTRGFMTGDFTEKGLVDDVVGLTPTQMLELDRWIKFYDKTYVYKGLLLGTFYDMDGEPTAAWTAAEELINEGQRDEDRAAQLRKRFPHCNSQFKQGVGGRVWCSDKSGGEQRDWVGVPRKYFMPGATKSRCACVRNTGPPSDEPSSEGHRGDLDNPGLQEYEGCDPQAVSCNLKNA